MEAEPPKHKRRQRKEFCATADECDIINDGKKSYLSVGTYTKKNYTPYWLIDAIKSDCRIESDINAVERGKMLISRQFEFVVKAQ